jgi:chemotaxis protein methyltransferase CheR
MTTQGTFEEAELSALLERIYKRHHYDFRGYSASALRRRLSGLLPSSGGTLAELSERLVSEGELFPRLLQALTVQVTDMFRDPGYFRFLREELAPVLGTYPSLKVWVAGCASGEEAYSIAIVLKETGLLERSLIYATDISPEALRRAEAGVYPSSRVAGFSKNHRRSGASCSFSEYYTESYDAIVMDRSLRRHIVFADHSLTTDAVFAEMQLISCRNVLIYFDAELQQRTLELMRQSLCRKGFLGLGSREGPRYPEFLRRFEQLSRVERWYQLRGALP